MSESYPIEVVLSARDQGFTNGLEAASRSASSLGKTIKSGLGFGVLTGIGMKAVNVLTSGLNRIASHTDAAIKRVDTLNNFPVIMKNLGYSSKDAKKALDKMGDGIDGLPTSMDAIASATQKIAPLTGSLSKATDVTLALNDALLAGGKSTEVQSNALEQYSQMLAAGKVDMQSWRSMMDAMPGQLDQVAKSLLGAKAGNMDLYNAMKEGAVSFDDFNKALLKLDKDGLKAGGKSYASFQEQAKSSTKGIATSMANMNTAITKGLANMINSVNKMLKRLGLPQINEMFDKAKDGINKAFNAINGKIDGIKSLDGAIDLIKGQFGGLIGVIGGGAVAIKGAPLFNGLLKGMSTVKKQIPTATGKINAELKKMSAGVKKAGSGMSKFVPSGVRKGLDSLTGGLKNTTASLRSAGQGLSDYLSNSTKFGKFFQLFQTGLGKLSGGVTATGGKIMQYFTSMMGLALKSLMPAALIATVLAGLGLLYQQFGTQIDSILLLAQTKGPGIIMGLANSITASLPGLIASGAQIVAELLNTITANIPSIVTAGTDIIISLVSGLGAALPTLIPAAVNAVTTFATSLASNIPRLIATGMQFLLSLVQGIVSSLPNLISGAITAIQTFITSIIQNLPTILATGVQIIATLAGGLINAIPQLIGAIPGLFSGIITAVTSIDWLDLGGDIIRAIGDGILGMGGWLMDTITGFFGGQEESSKESGSKVSKSAAEGVKEGEAEVSAAADELTQKLGTDLNAGIDGVSAGANASMNTMSTQLSQTLASGDTEAAKTKGQETGEAYVTGMQLGIAKLPEIATQAIQSLMTALSSQALSGIAVGAKLATSFQMGFQTGLTVTVVAVKAAMALISAAFLSALPSILVIGSGMGLIGNSASVLAQALSSAQKSMVSMASSSASAASSMKIVMALLAAMAGKAASAGIAVGVSFASGISGGIKKAAANTKTGVSQIAVAFKSGVSASKLAGKLTGNNYVLGIKAAGPKAKLLAVVAVKAVVACLKNGRSGALSAGKMISSGFASGMRSMLGSIRSAADAIVNQANRAIRAKAKIHSPSKVTRQFGEYYGQGWVLGIEDMSRRAGRAVRDLVTYPDVRNPVLAGSFSGELFSDYDYNRRSNVAIEVPLQIDGRTVAKTTARYTEEELNRRNRHDKRKKGIR